MSQQIDLARNAGEVTDFLVAVARVPGLDENLSLSPGKLSVALYVEDHYARCFGQIIVFEGSVTDCPDAGPCERREFVRLFERPDDLYAAFLSELVRKSARIAGILLAVKAIEHHSVRLYRKDVQNIEKASQ